MTEVEARRPRTKGELLRLGGLRWLWWGMDDDLGRGAAAKDQWPTPAARWPACVGGGTANDRGRGAVAKDQGPTSVAQGPAVGGLGNAGCLR